MKSTGAVEHLYEGRDHARDGNQMRVSLKIQVVDLSEQVSRQSTHEYDLDIPIPSIDFRPVTDW